MQNAIKYGVIIGIVSGVWIVIMHFGGIYENPYPVSDQFSWLEIASVIIPFIGLYLGIRNFRNQINGGKLSFFEGVFEGFKIMIVGGVIAAGFATIYISYVHPDIKMDFMGRIFGAGLVGILFTLLLSLMLMNKHRNL